MSRMVVFVALGGAIGSVLRYLVSLPINERAAPWGTVLVNLIGSAVLGFLLGLWIDRPVDPAIQLGVTTGMLGGFTTFSTFTVETAVLLDAEQFQLAALNVVFSLVLGIAAAAVGFQLGRS